MTSKLVELLSYKIPLLVGDDPDRKRKEISDYFHKTFCLDEELYQCLIEDERAFYQKPNPLRHPLIFYFGHTATFYVNKLLIAGLLPQRINEHFEANLAVGVDEMSWDDLDDKRYKWPSLNEIRNYRSLVREAVDYCINKTPLTLPISWNDPFWIILMCIEHQRVHIETSSVLIREQEVDLVQTHPLFKVCNQDHNTVANSFLEIQGAEITLGKKRDNWLYGWDNEYGHQKTIVQDFHVAQFLVSHHEFYEFMLDNGYEKQEYWEEEGWNWRQYSQANHPHFWQKIGNKYKYRWLTGLIDIPWSWPVDLNYHEAKAFCNWKSKVLNKKLRMPTEAEWMLLRQRLPSDLPDWCHKSAPGNINLSHWASACPVNMFNNGDGIYDLIGNIWQWTETPIYPFDGFKPHKAYDDFSLPTFDGKHNIMKGGCFFSSGNYAIRESRYAFRRHFFQHAGLRYIEPIKSKLSILINNITQSIYESDEQLSQYLEFHYGNEYFGVRNYPKQCVEVVIEFLTQLDKPCQRALDIGCAVGRSTFELARQFLQVDGIDFSARFIHKAVQLQEGKEVSYAITREGLINEKKTVTLQQFDLAKTAPRCRFMQGDACNLPVKFSGYDLIFASNLLDRLYAPRKFLDIAYERLNPGGILVISSPYTWLEEHTPINEWIGGQYDRSDQEITTLDALIQHFENRFKLLDKPRDLQFVIRETSRKYQHSIAQLTIWEKI